MDRSQTTKPVRSGNVVVAGYPTPPRRPSGRIVELAIEGRLYSKKNHLQFNRRSSHPYYPSDVRACMDSVRAQIEHQWTDDRGNAKQTLSHPAIAIAFYVNRQGLKSDRDGLWTTVLDELVNAGVLKDDSIESFNSEVLLCKSVLTETPDDGRSPFVGARIFLEPNGNFGPLWRYVQKVQFSSYYIIGDAHGRRFPRL